MTDSNTATDIVELDASKPVWDRCFMVAPLVLVGTRDEDGSLDLAPKHMAFPMGWQNYFGFVCTPSHKTYANIERTGQFATRHCHDRKRDDRPDHPQRAAQRIAHVLSSGSGMSMD